MLKLIMTYTAMFLLWCCLASRSEAYTASACPSEIPEWGRIDCYPEGGSTEIGCISRGCMWCETSVQGPPWCFYNDRNEHNVDCQSCSSCMNKVDCYPESGSHAMGCIGRGCLWCPSTTPNQPWCIKHGITDNMTAVSLTGSLAPSTTTGTSTTLPPPPRTLAPSTGLTNMTLPPLPSTLTPSNELNTLPSPTSILAPPTEGTALPSSTATLAPSLSTVSITEGTILPRATSTFPPTTTEDMKFIPVASSLPPSTEYIKPTPPMHSLEPSTERTSTTLPPLTITIASSTEYIKPTPPIHSLEPSTGDMKLTSPIATLPPFTTTELTSSTLSPPPITIAPSTGTFEPAIVIHQRPQLSSRIAYGDDAILADSPWQGLLGEAISPTEIKRICGCSLISNEWAITAAHCTKRINATESMILAFGVSNLSRLAVDDVFRVAYVIVHPDYEPGDDFKFPKHDVSLMRVDGSVSSSENVRAVTLAHADSEVFNGTVCNITGWGQLSPAIIGYDDGTLHDILQEAAVPVVSQSQCQEWFTVGLLNPLTVYPEVLCAGYADGSGGDGCRGDYGGPLVCHDGAAYVLHGITSYDPGCGLSRNPGIYTRVSSHAAWISNRTGITIPTPRPRAAASDVGAIPQESATAKPVVDFLLVSATLLPLVVFA